MYYRYYRSQSLTYLNCWWKTRLRPWPIDKKLPVKLHNSSSTFSTDKSNKSRTGPQSQRNLKHFKVVLAILACALSACVTTRTQLQYSTENSKVTIKVFDIDDEAGVYITPNGMNERKVLTVAFATDSGWRDITNKLRDGINHIRFEIYNGKYGGWKGKYKIKIEDEEVLFKEEGSDGGPNSAVVHSRVFQIKKKGNEYSFIE